MVGKFEITPIQSTEEAKAKGSAGGKASVEARRKKKMLRQAMTTLLQMEPDVQDYNALVEMGFPQEDINNAALLTVALFRKALKGDVAAYREIRDLVGEVGQDEDKSKDLSIRVSFDAPVGAEGDMSG